MTHSRDNHESEKQKKNRNRVFRVLKRANLVQKANNQSLLLSVTDCNYSEFAKLAKIEKVVILTNHVPSRPCVHTEHDQGFV